MKKKRRNKYGEYDFMCSECCNFYYCSRPRQKSEPRETLACDNFDQKGKHEKYCTGCLKCGFTKDCYWKREFA